jgi:hypothetical protein
MHEVRPSPDSSERITVLDDLGSDCPITPAELDAIEAFLMPLVGELFGKEDRGLALADSAAPQNFAPV